MKKILCLVLVLVLMLSAFVACGNEPNGDLPENETHTSSGDKTDKADTNFTAPEGFTLYQNENIAFAYPSDWTQIDDDPTFVSPDNTKSITLTQQETSYEGLDTQKYVQKVRPELEAQGKKLVSARVGQEDKNGLTVTDILQTFSTEGQEGETYQNIYAFDIKGKTYVITVTQPNGFEVDKTLGETVCESIVMK